MNGQELEIKIRNIKAAIKRFEDYNIDGYKEINEVEQEIEKYENSVAVFENTIVINEKQIVKNQCSLNENQKQKAVWENELIIKNKVSSSFLARKSLFLINIFKRNKTMSQKQIENKIKDINNLNEEIENSNTDLFKENDLCGMEIVNGKSSIALFKKAIEYKKQMIAENIKFIHQNQKQKAVWENELAEIKLKPTLIDTMTLSL